MSKTAAKTVVGPASAPAHDAAAKGSQLRVRGKQIRPEEGKKEMGKLKVEWSLTHRLVALVKSAGALHFCSDSAWERKVGGLLNG